MPRMQVVRADTSQEPQQGERPILDAFIPSHAFEVGPLLILSVILLAGASGGWVAGRLHIPRITGNIVAGLLLGSTLLKDTDTAQVLEPLTAFAIGLIAASVGANLSYRRIHNALRRIVSIAVLEGVCAAVCVALAIRLFPNTTWPIVALLGCIAAATAPATTVAIIRETRAKGSFVKTLLSVVALDNILCIVLFAFVQFLVADYYVRGATPGLTRAILTTGGQFLACVVLGCGLGAITERLVRDPRFHKFSVTLLALLLAAGLSSFLGLSPPLTTLLFGIYLGNRSREAQEQLHSLEPIEPLLYICFFTVAGAGLHLTSLWHAGLWCLAYVVARFVGKGLGACIGGVMSGTSRRIWSNIPLGLMPQAGIAIGLVVLLEGDQRIPAETTELVGAVVLAAVTISEIIGPFFTRAALRRASEAGLDRPRLMEFLQEEFILTDIQAADKWEALSKLTNFFALTHNVRPRHRAKIHASVVERERELSTAVGVGCAIPHGRIDAGSAVQGVLGICREGIDFDAPDGEPVRLIVLIVTPKEHEKRHLEVMASLASMMSNEMVRERLVAAIDANDAWEAIEHQEGRGYNYFLDELTEGADKTA